MILKISPSIDIGDLPTLETAVIRYRSEVIDSIDRIMVAISKAKEEAVKQFEEKCNDSKV